MKTIHEVFETGRDSGHYSIVVRGKRGEEELTFRLHHRHYNCNSETTIEVLKSDLTFAKVAEGNDFGAVFVQYHKYDNQRYNEMLSNIEKSKEYIGKVWQVK